MVFVPRNASDEQVLDIVREWVDMLGREDYQAVFDELGLILERQIPGPECIRDCIKSYRSPDYYPDVDDFTVTDWRMAQGGNPEPEREVIWYHQPNAPNMAGAVSFDLPLNGCWSDLTADFVFYETDHPEGYLLALEEIRSWEQRQRDYDESEQSD